MPFAFEEDILMLLPMLLTGIPTGLFRIAMYVLTSYALYTLAVRRGLRKAWLAWIPVLNCWILGSLSDQYQYVAKGEIRSKRKILMILNVLMLVLCITVLVLAAVLIAGAFLANNSMQFMANIHGPAVAILGLCVPLLGAGIAAAVIRYMALYDVYRSADPANSVLFLVLSILLRVTEPFFLFFNREKDGGMPPRKQPEPAQTYEYAAYEYDASTVQDPEPQKWDEKSYL